MRSFRPVLLAPLALAACGQAGVRPNVVLIVADDLGKGDISAYGAQTIQTPNIDGIARRGVCFNNGYATSATSTPSRYAMMTGMYPWTNPNAKIMPGDAPLIIAEDQPTMPKMFQAAGYATAAIGKWHLGMGDGNTDWNKPIVPSANSVGFDYTCLIAATNDRVPTVYVRNGSVVGLDPDDPISISYEEPFEGELTADNHPEMLRYGLHHGHNNTIVNGISRIGHMKGGEAARWKDEEMAEYFLSEVKGYLDTVGTGRPFFLYYGLHQPHVPRVPNARFAGKSGYGVRGDVILEADWCVGELLAYLEEKGLMDNTLIIFTSDNGAVVQDGYLDGSDEQLGDHDPSFGMRGGKYSLFDGGTHIPLFAYWKGHTRRRTTDAFFSQMDFFASLARLAGGAVPEGLDSRDYLDVLLGRSDKGRRSLLLEAKSRLCYREGDYVIIPPYKGKKTDKTGTEIGNFDDYVLYDLSTDKGQREDIKEKEPAVFERMKATFHALAGDWYRLQPEPNYKKK